MENDLCKIRAERGGYLKIHTRGAEVIPDSASSHHGSYESQNGAIQTQIKLLQPSINNFRNFLPGNESKKLKYIRAHLVKINKPAVKTIQSPDGDLIDCVLSHQQPAFDHPQLKGQKPMDPPERPKGHILKTDIFEEKFQVWSMSDEFCPEGTVPIRRTSEEDVLRASSVRRFGRKIRRPIRRDSSSNGHEHAVGYVSGEEYYGAKASINVWAPRVANQYEFSLSQMWVSPELYGDNYPRFFTYWTSDAYQATGCYNLLCSGFVQTNNRIAIGAAISPTSSYNGGQFDISLLAWKDPKHGNWWLEFGNGILVGYWPSFLFTHLRERASMVQFGGEIVNSRNSGAHTSTQMGSGHFAGEGFGKASYFRNLQVVDWDNNLIPLSNLHVLADHQNCYDIRGGINRVWGVKPHYLNVGDSGFEYLSGKSSSLISQFKPSMLKSIQVVRDHIMN
ncbi:hypothetical protein DH2020_049740 [Rehmannia glutinosa]|uniref:Neprosin PEP catalytic domain-containing protein n=1 Tax=Rehmannia glutinosa TaxID=99300 RepID=A0ABR0U2V3_REHGL